MITAEVLETPTIPVLSLHRKSTVDHELCDLSFGISEVSSLASADDTDEESDGYDRFLNAPQFTKAIMTVPAEEREGVLLKILDKMNWKWTRCTFSKVWFA